MGKKEGLFKRNGKTEAQNRSDDLKGMVKTENKEKEGRRESQLCIED